MDFQLMKRRYGPTVHLTPTGELDLDTRAALGEVQTDLDAVAAVACDMRHLTFMDVTGLHGLTAFAHRLGIRGIAFFAYNWQPQPLRLMNLIDSLYQPADRNGNHGGATQLLRRSVQGSATAAGAARAARQDTPIRAASPSRQAAGRARAASPTPSG
ncbi:STAS domain-containing protein (plasmid) [Streptomyces avidinii]|uniref:STAS domain-containing protein n=1 Tax=Streptomyces avidinii TaxID=1895 RepID=UPI002F913B86|nr:STAS domain-containing protein [Streptomyces avidinii]